MGLPDMRNVVAGLLTTLLALLPWTIAFNWTSAFGVSDQGPPAITRLWSSDSRFVCTASYIRPRVNDRASWVLSAGHCVHGLQTLARNADTTTHAVVNWRGVLLEHGNYGKAVVDLAIGTAPDVRDLPKE